MRNDTAVSPPIVEKFNSRLVGWPDRWLTVLLLVIAGVVAIVAIRGKPYAKMIVAAWLVAP